MDIEENPILEISKNSLKASREKQEAENKHKLKSKLPLILFLLAFTALGLGCLIGFNSTNRINYTNASVHLAEQFSAFFWIFIFCWGTWFIKQVFILAGKKAEQ